MKPIFAIGIQFDEKTGTYVAQIESLTEIKKMLIVAKSIKILMTNVSKAVRDRRIRNVKFPPPPPPEPSIIIVPGGNGDRRRLVLPGRN